MNSGRTYENITIHSGGPQIHSDSDALQNSPGSNFGESEVEPNPYVRDTIIQANYGIVCQWCGYEGVTLVKQTTSCT